MPHYESQSKNHLISKFAQLFSVVLCGLYITACSNLQGLNYPILVEAAQPKVISYLVIGSRTQRLTIDLDNPSSYANISVYADDSLLVDNLNVPTTGKQTLNTLVRFDVLGKVKLTLQSNGADVTINGLHFEEVAEIHIPQYSDISVQAGVDKVNSIKYGGPTIADMDNDGDYDFIVNNHNQADSKLYWNNGDGTVSAHDKNLSRWFMHDLHGTAAGDYDNDGDLDLVVTQGGGNGTNPSTANFYRNDNGKLILMTGDVGIDKGGRGRGARWSDMDLDGDLDLMLLNEEGLAKQKPQHFFYENKGDGTFKYKAIAGLQDVHPSRALITDLNNDNIDDVILYGPLSVWLGNGDFTFTDITEQFPAKVASLHNIMAISDLDIDNDGDLDLYLAKGKAFEGGLGESPAMDFDPINKTFSIKPRGYKGVDEFAFSAEGKIKFHNYYFLAQGAFRGKDYPIFFGSNKQTKILASGEDMEFEASMAEGWPSDISENGMYFGHVGNGQWKAALVRNGDIFWGFKFSLDGVSAVTPKFVPQNRNEADVLLRNDGGKFTDVSQQWNLPTGGNSLGVTVGDFNNDSHQDIFVYRWGYIGGKTSDYMLLNNGEGSFDTVTMHGANDIGGPGNGDMGQAFDFDGDGDLDLLNGSEGGQWYLYANDNPGMGHHASIRVGYAPNSNIDPISAEVIVKTPLGEYRKRVGSAGEVFSQSLLNIVHFGLGDATTIDSIHVRWRNGETVEFKNKAANALFDTDKLDPSKLSLIPAKTDIRKGTTLTLQSDIYPEHANQSLVWSSSDDSVLTVNRQGKVNAVGKVGQTANIKATSEANNLSSSSQVSIVKWYPQEVESVSVEYTENEIFAGEALALSAKVLPQQADNPQLTWHTSDSKIATVDEQGVVMAKSAGQVTIQAASSNGIKETVLLTVKPFIKPFIEIIDADKIKETEFVVGDSIELTANYHAGSGNTVISSDQGGVKFWLRHFKNQWIPKKDVVKSDAAALKTESGTSSMSFSLAGLTPSAELPEGQFYYLRASFTASDGIAHSAHIYPIKIVAKP